MPPGSEPTIAPGRGSGWRPGVAHREMSVAFSRGWTLEPPADAHREKGIWEKRVDARTTEGKVQRGFEDLESDSHHLRWVRCSNWALDTLGLGHAATASTPASVKHYGCLVPGLDWLVWLLAARFGDGGLWPYG